MHQVPEMKQNGPSELGRVFDVSVNARVFLAHKSVQISRSP